MSLPSVVRTVLVSGTTVGLIPNIYVGRNEVQGSFPVVLIDAINPSIDFRNVSNVSVAQSGQAEEISELSISIIAATRELCDDTADAINVDLTAVSGTTQSGLFLRWIKYEGRSKWGFEKVTGLWSRIITFKIFSQIDHVVKSNFLMRMSFDGGLLDGLVDVEFGIEREYDSVMRNASTDPGVTLGHPFFTIEGKGISILNAVAKSQYDLFDNIIAGTRVAIQMISTQSSTNSYSGNGYLQMFKLTSSIQRELNGVMFLFKFIGSDYLVKDP